MLTEAAKIKAIEIIDEGMLKTIENYTNNALLINSCFNSVEKYCTLDGDRILSTTDGIPPELKLDAEIDCVFKFSNLTKKYKDELQSVVFENYVITSISVTDAIFEKLFEYFFRYFNASSSDEFIADKVRNAWTNNSLIDFLTNPSTCDLKKPSRLKIEFSEAFFRYLELRIIRHSLVHSNGQVSEKNMIKLEKLKEETPLVRQNFCIVNSGIIDSYKIVLNTSSILMIRKYLYTYLSYIRQSLKEAPTHIS